jgi:hypothetical protein
VNESQCSLWDMCSYTQVAIATIVTRLCVVCSQGVTCLWQRKGAHNQHRLSLLPYGMCWDWRNSSASNMWYNIAQPDGSTRIYETNACVAVRRKEQAVKEAAEYRVNITDTHHMTFMLQNAWSIPDYLSVTCRFVDWYCKTGIFIMERGTFV